MKDRDSFRGTSIDKTFADLFKESCFYKDIYNKHKNEIIIGVRDSYINLYYNCDSIAKIDVLNPNECEINKYYINGKKNQPNIKLSGEELVKNYEIIKTYSYNQKKNEKQAQQRLFIDNNNNPFSDWYCIDVEYTKSLKGKKNPEDWRIDIIAISKIQPFRVALIELKYGSGAFHEPSGIRTHVKDFYSFYKNKKFDMLKPEIISIIDKLSLLGIDVPESFKSISCENINPEPEFYFITLNNNSESPSGNTPKQTMGGYLFADKTIWGTNRLSSWIKKEGDYFELIEHCKSFKPVFLFSKATLSNLNICDILDRKYYDIETIDL